MAERRLFLPEVAACAVLLGIVVAFILHIRDYTNGLFVYPLDDTYIHLAVAKTLAVHHIWGVGQSGFASASSSPGWTVALAFLNVLFGVHLMTPIWLNLTLSIVLFSFVGQMFARFAPRGPLWMRYAVPAVLIFASPVPNLVLLGMEHLAQTLSVCVLLIATALATGIENGRALARGHLFVLLFSAFACGALRYESVFAIAPCCLLMLVRKRVGLASLTALFGALSPALFAIFSYYHCGYLLPFSVLAKAQASGIRQALTHPATVILGKFSHLPLILPLFLTWLSRAGWRNRWNALNVFLLLSCALTTEHLYLANIGWLMRYETYFVFVALLALLFAAADSKWIHAPRVLLKAGVVPLLLSFLVTVSSIKLGWALLERVRAGVTLPAMAAQDRFDEHVQMARFVTNFYDHDPVLLDDIGAVAFYSDAKLLDILGLGSIEPRIAASSHKPVDSAFIQQWANAEGASLAITQPVPEVLRITPSGWVLLQVWQQPRNVVFADRKTAIYATSNKEVPRLCRALNAFRLTSHDTVVVNRCG